MSVGAAGLPYKAPHETSAAQRAALGRLSAGAEIVTHRLVQRDDGGRPLVLATVDVLAGRWGQPHRHNPRPTMTTKIVLLDWGGHPRRSAEWVAQGNYDEPEWRLWQHSRHTPTSPTAERTGVPLVLPWPEGSEERSAVLAAVMQYVENNVKPEQEMT